MDSPQIISSKSRILVIDDNQDIHADFRKILIPASQQNAAMDSAESALFGSSTPNMPGESFFALDDAFQGQEGVQMVTNACADGDPYALAFVDMRMPPGWDGLETISRLWPIDPALQIVICTAFSDHSWQDIFARFGDTDRLLVIKKPFDPIEVNQIARALTKKWSQARKINRYIGNLELTAQQRVNYQKATNLDLSDSITEYIGMENEQRRADNRFRSLISASHNAIITVAENGFIDLWNPSADKIFGFSTSPTTKTHISTIFKNFNSTTFIPLIEKLAEDTIPPRPPLRIQGNSLDGRELTFNATVITWDSRFGRGYAFILS